MADYDTHGLMPRIGGGDYYSRDYELPTIPCGVRCCACNKDGKCEMPSAIKINAGGVCETGLKYLPKKR